ncbi:hypothetical protein AM593_03690, partial [Mytilus galloprovincialis]
METLSSVQIEYDRFQVIFVKEMEVALSFEMCLISIYVAFPKGKDHAVGMKQVENKEETCYLNETNTQVKWNVINKSIKIGAEAILSCDANDCSQNMRKTWYGGRNGDVKDSSKFKDDRFIVEVEMKVYPIPNCSIVYKAKEYNASVKKAGSVKTNKNVSELFTVTITAALDVEQSELKCSLK